MNADSWFARLSAEAQELFRVLSPGTLLILVVAVTLAVFAGRLVRSGVYVLWRLSIDPERRLAPLGSLVQVALLGVIVTALLRTLVSHAPVASFLLLLALSPFALQLVIRPAQDALAGVVLLFRRTILEGDHVVLGSGERGVIRQISMTSTIARTDDGGRLLIPNRRLVESVVQVDRRQTGSPLHFLHHVAQRPDATTLALVKKVLYLSPFRSARSVVHAHFDDSKQAIVLSMRVARENAKDDARRELEVKLAKLLSPAEKAEG